MNDDNAMRMAEAEAAELALQRFLRPAFDICRAEYTKNLMTIGAQPMSQATLAGITNLSVALKVLAEAQEQIETIVADGKVAKDGAERASRMAQLTNEQRKWAGY